jgi:uncharacterized protein (DUF983 family)
MLRLRQMVSQVSGREEHDIDVEKTYDKSSWTPMSDKSPLPILVPKAFRGRLFDGFLQVRPDKANL